MRTYSRERFHTDLMQKDVEKGKDGAPVTALDASFADEEDIKWDAFAERVALKMAKPTTPIHSLLIRDEDGMPVYTPKHVLRKNAQDEDEIYPD